MWVVKIPMRDDVKSNATVYKPRVKEPTSVIFTFTTYIADSYHPRAYLAKNGYSIALVDCRKRGNSKGNLNPFSCEAQTGMMW